MAGGGGLQNSSSNFVENLDLQIGAVEIKDGSSDNRAKVSADGCLSVEICGSGGSTLTNPLTNVYDEAISVPVNTPTTLVSYTVPAGFKFRLLGGYASGDADGIFTFYIGATKITKKRTSWNDRETFFDYIDRGFEAPAGTLIKIEVTNTESPPLSNSPFDYWGNLFGALVAIADTLTDPLTNTYNESAPIPVNTPTDVVSYTVPVGYKFLFLGAYGGGDADGIFTLYTDLTKVSRLRSSWNDRNVFFNYLKNGIELAAGTVIKVQVINKEGPPLSNGSFVYWGNIFGVLSTA